MNDYLDHISDLDFEILDMTEDELHDYATEAATAEAAAARPALRSVDAVVTDRRRDPVERPLAA